jgi:hypothetical protein
VGWTPSMGCGAATTAANGGWKGGYTAVVAEDVAEEGVMGT